MSAAGRLIRVGTMTWRQRLTGAFARTSIFVAAAVLILVTFRTTGIPGDSWAVTSVALVMQDKAKASVRTAAIRVVVNVVSAFIALAAVSVGGATIPSYAIALLVVGLLCYLTGLDDGIRSAYICVLIVIGTDPRGLIAPAIERVGAVAVGSLIGIAVSLVFAKIDTANRAPSDAGSGDTGRGDGPS